MRCTEKKQHKGSHHDASVDIKFNLPDKIRQRKDGNT